MSTFLWILFGVSAVLLVGVLVVYSLTSDEKFYDEEDDEDVNGM